VDGVPTSLCDLGYCDVGLDDNWQACGAGHKFSYHNDAGVPIINRDRFPDMEEMTKHAHKLGLSAGWYGNNCICAETDVTTDMYQADVTSVTEFGFDAIKLDGCGKQMDLDLWANLFNASGRPVMIENCHWGGTVPNETWCPWNFFRTSGDVRASYGSVVGNLQTTVQWAQKQLSKPGCWAYPDMLEVGCQHGPGGPSDPGLSMAEARSHFAAWCIISSPLTLSHDVNDDTVMDQIWPIIANKEAIAINQGWYGESGMPFKQSNAIVALSDYNQVIQGVLTAHTDPTPSWQYFYKPLGPSKVAVLLMNHAASAQTLTLELADVPGLDLGSCNCASARDVWAQEDLDVAKGTFMAKDVASHDSVFLVLSKGGDIELVV